LEFLLQKEELEIEENILTEKHKSTALRNAVAIQIAAKVAADSELGVKYYGSYVCAI